MKGINKTTLILIQCYVYHQKCCETPYIFYLFIYLHFNCDCFNHTKIAFSGPDEISSPIVPTKPVTPLRSHYNTQIKSSFFCNNVDTCKGKTNTECVLYSGKEICQCILGYQKFDKTGSCKGGRVLLDWRKTHYIND